MPERPRSGSPRRRRRAGEGIRVLETRPAEADAGLPFAGLGDLVESTLDEVLDELPEPQADALRVALLLAPPGQAPLDERAVAVAVLGVLRELARTGRVLVAVDDVQWLDPPSAKVVSFAWRRLREEPVGILLAHRLGTNAPAALVEDDRFSSLAVGPLALGAVHRLLHSRLDLVLPRPALRRVHEVSGGNPFFSLELGRALLAHEGRAFAGRAAPGPRPAPGARSLPARSTAAGKPRSPRRGGGSLTADDRASRRCGRRRRERTPTRARRPGDRARERPRPLHPPVARLCRVPEP